MPANLPPQYMKAEAAYRQAATPPERLEKLRDLFRLLPKHKGTEKLQSELKKKISRAREDLEGAQAGGKKSGPSFKVPREGAGQVVLLGAPNAGKSALVAALTQARPDVAPYPFTTRAPQPGMMSWKDTRIQLVDLPPITADVLDPWLPGLVRAADAAWLVADLASDDVIDAAATVIDRLAAAHVELAPTLSYDVEDESTQHLNTLLVANKSDAEGAAERLEILRECFAERGTVTIQPVSVESGEGLDSLRNASYHLLRVVRIYTKIPGRPVDRTKPLTLPIGSTVLDLAGEIHQDFRDSLKSARVWGRGVPEGQTVKRDHELHDEDVVELQIDAR